MNWTSLDEMVSDIGLTAAPNDVTAVRRELRKCLAETHPDRNGGDFQSKDDEAQFNRLRMALDYVDKVTEEAKALVPITQLPAIVKAIGDMRIAPVDVRVSQLTTECKSEARTDIKSRYSLPRIGSGVFAAVCGFLVTFGQTFKDHPLLGQIADSYVTQMFLLVLAVYAGLFFALTWYAERRQEARLEWLLSEAGRRE